MPAMSFGPAARVIVKRGGIPFKSPLAALHLVSGSLVICSRHSHTRHPCRDVRSSSIHAGRPGKSLRKPAVQQAAEKPQGRKASDVGWALLTNHVRYRVRDELYR